MVLNCCIFLHPKTELPTFKKSPELEVSVDDVTGEVKFACISEGLDNQDLTYKVDWFWGYKKNLTGLSVVEKAGKYVSRITEQNITRLAFGQEVNITYSLIS
jgi:hypothetical protein